MKSVLTRTQALEASLQIQQGAFTSSWTDGQKDQRWYAEGLGYGEDEEFWGQVGLLHDIDFELYPEQHCVKAPELLREAGVGEDMIHAIVSHGYGICVDVVPEHEMEKVLFAADELTGLIGAAAKMRRPRA